VKLGAFVITFRRPEGLRCSIDYLLGQTRRPDEILVVDNAADPATEAAVTAYHDHGVRYHASTDNIGPAGGLATGFALLGDLGCEWFLAIDDDDAPTGPGSEFLVQNLVDLIERNDDGRLGIVGINGSRFDWQTGEHARVADDELVGDIELDVIGGGAGLTVSHSLVSDIGPPEAALFFGHDDVLFCLAARRHGYRVMVNGEVMLAARASAGRLGMEAVRRTLVATDPYHALWRRYYVTRNYIYGMRHVLDQPHLARRMAAKATAQSVLAFSRGPKYGSRYTTMQLRGIVDGYRARLGRTIQPVPKPTAA
jgi:GT2 family glycosyltransferase